MTKMTAAYPKEAVHDGGPFQLLWTILCWATAFSAVVVTTAVLMK